MGRYAILGLEIVAVAASPEHARRDSGVNWQCACGEFVAGPTADDGIRQVEGALSAMATQDQELRALGGDQT
ncbi:hypothetical protein GCM10009612_72420 [Streptomyces beijiangensis]